MALVTSGTIGLEAIQTELGGSNPIGLKEYYRGGSFVTANNTNVPTAGTITLKNFYGATTFILPTVPTWTSPTVTLSGSGNWSKPGSIGDNDWVVFYLLGGGGGMNTTGGTSQGGGGGARLIAVKGSDVPSSMAYVVGSGGSQGQSPTVGGSTTITLTSGSYLAGGGGIGTGTVGQDPPDVPGTNSGGFGGGGGVNWWNSSGIATTTISETNIVANSSGATNLSGGRGGSVNNGNAQTRVIGAPTGSDWGGRGLAASGSDATSTFPGSSGQSGAGGFIRIFYT